MANCPNCGAHLGCSCQIMTLPDGRRGCSNCYPKATNTVPSSKVSAQEFTPAQKSIIIKQNGSS